MLKNLKMKIMVVITVMSLLLSTVVIFAANNNWADQVFIKANEQIGKAGFDKKEELVSNMDSRIADHVAQKTDGKIETKKDEVEELEVKVTRPEVDVPLSENLQDHIWELCQHYDMSYELVLALIKAESDFREDIVSYNRTSLGLMQLNKNTYPTLAKELGIKNFDPFNPNHNSRAGIYYLVKIREDLLKKGLCDEEILPIMLITYHRGKAGARKYISRNGVRSKYVNNIMKQKYLYEGS